MRALRFQLKGETAFFKKPDVNVYAYFTYSHIHKIALLGLLGAILGYGGYTQQYEANYPLGGKRKQAEKLQVYPEFYEVLRQARISIVPHGERGYFAKKIQIFNNTVGYASQEEGNILNIREQWLEKPEWTIYVADDGSLAPEVFAKLTDYLLHSQSVYMPYLGKNDHPAALKHPALVELAPADKPSYIDSLHRTGHIAYDAEGKPKAGQRLSFFKEFMPLGLNEANNGYLLEQLVLTNQEIDIDSYQESDLRHLYSDSDEERVIYFI
ncbi:type I-B CRISPR-associated protein Cas5 [Paenibacillus sp. SYP-B3998]|uniref:Type I-B CRISPR-associated protein Cas5 n=1 Tax=Paenibacillus sp. SYP-B3998 TaxID=2678564 RepID=A0A6G4A075_9BACL|nr:type I-B CRISPR-associated protein Cas5b [Paenibacillus sp. SYP-B3998]NEW07863.1 type I-B CRISPR-associated protein Cas5 [Paenibacillus sp. SYP-B3998]